MFYNKHMFLCTNKKQDGSGCGSIAPDVAFNFVKDYLLSKDMWGQGKYRVSKSGCLGRCADGPVCVIYPDGIWYTYVDEADLKQIIDEHLIDGSHVARLLIP